MKQFCGRCSKDSQGVLFDRSHADGSYYSVCTGCAMDEHIGVDGPFKTEKLEGEIQGYTFIVGALKAKLALAKKTLEYYAACNIGSTKTCLQCKSLTILNIGDEGTKARETLEKLK